MSRPEGTVRKLQTNQHEPSAYEENRNRNRASQVLTPQQALSPKADSEHKNFGSHSVRHNNPSSSNIPRYYNDRFTTTNQINQIALLRQSAENATQNKLLY